MSSKPPTTLSKLVGDEPPDNGLWVIDDAADRLVQGTKGLVNSHYSWDQRSAAEIVASLHDPAYIRRCGGWVMAIGRVPPGLRQIVTAAIPGSSWALQHINVAWPKAFRLGYPQSWGPPP